MTDEPPVRKLSELRASRVSTLHPRKLPQHYADFSEYYGTEIEPRLGAADKFPPVRLGYPALKRRR